MIQKGEKRCPFCGGRLQPRGHVKRKLKLGDGEITTIKLRRYSCAQCNRWHRELPNDIIPYRHYPKTIVDKFNDGRLDDKHIGFESYPVAITKSRWKLRKKKPISLCEKEDNTMNKVLSKSEGDKKMKNEDKTLNSKKKSCIR